MSVSKPKPNYAFIDSQNLNLGIRSQGWQIDYKKFRLYLKNKYSISNAYMFIGMVANNQPLYTQLQEAGFILVFKPTVQYFQDGKLTVKGNVDAELVLHASAIQYPNYERAVIVTGDGDFACLIEFLVDKEKLLQIITPNTKYSQLLKPFSSHIVTADRLKESLKYQKSQHRRSVETLGLSGNGDKSSIAKKAVKVNRSQRGPANKRDRK